MYYEFSRFHPNRFAVGGVIAERANTAKLRPKLIPIFASKPNNNRWSFIPQIYLNSCNFITLGASSGKRTVTVSRLSIRLSVCPVSIHTVTHQGAARDTARAHFGPTIRKTDILVCSMPLSYHLLPHGHTFSLIMSRTVFPAHFHFALQNNGVWYVATSFSPLLSFTCIGIVAILLGLKPRHFETFREYRLTNGRENALGNQLAPYGTDGRLFTTDVSAKFKVSHVSQKLEQI